MFDARAWAMMPFHFWSVVFFVFGSVVGSFLNVCIYRMPRGESLVHPPSHCPHCQYHIPFYLNIPLVTWWYLQGRCRHCGAPIQARYFLVELLTALVYLGCWLRFGGRSPGLALVYCLMFSGFIVATFIDLEHLIIPDEITLGGIGAGFLCSFAVPLMHGATNPAAALKRSLIGILVGAGLVYSVLRLAKLFFGRQRFELPPDTTLRFGEEGLQLPDRQIPYEDIFYRQTDEIRLHAKWAYVVKRRFSWRARPTKYGVALVAKTTAHPLPRQENVPLRVSTSALRIGEEIHNPEEVMQLEVVTDQVIVPREAMGLGDVKFMAAIGAFLGWPATVFSLFASSVIGSVVGVLGLLVCYLCKREWSSRIPYGPYIAAAAALWIFGGQEWVAWWFGR